MDATHHFSWAALIFIPLVLLGLAMFAFWLWMLVDCAKNQNLQGQDKLVWILIIALVHFPGALIYFFVGRNQRPPPGVSEFKA